jgi:ferredoxin
MTEAISRQSLLQLVGVWLGQGKRVFAPVQVKPGLVLYEWIREPSQIHLDASARPANSIKEAVFPRHEKLYDYRYAGKQIELTGAVLPETPQIVLGARPCDAAALEILDPVFNWDDADGFYNHWRRLTTVVSLACQGHDEHCFCTSVGLGPDDSRGADAMLVDLGGDRYEVRSLTRKGISLLAGHTEPSTETGTIAPGPAKRFDVESIRRLLADGFDKLPWPAMSLRCLGCGACAYACPTCHCFDIVDEGDARGGCRARNWDTCQFAMFTQHASGHNPRSVQGQRQRQRIFHKFRMYPDKFDEVLCTGCGNCTRVCPAALGVGPVLETIGQTAEPETVKEGQP